MPISLDHYKHVSNTDGKIMTSGSTVHLSKSGDALVLHGSSLLGRMVSWFRGFRSAQHAEVRANFIEALTSQYGSDVAVMVASEARLNHVEHIKKALTSRDIFIAFKIADKYEGQIKDKKQSQDAHNNDLANRYVDSSTSDTATQLVESKLSEVLSKIMPDDGDNIIVDMTAFREFVDAAGLKIKEGILKKGNNGEYQLSEAEADSIADKVLQDAIIQTYKKSVFDKYFIPTEGSKNSNESIRLLSQFYERHDMTLEAERLNNGTIDELNNKIEKDVLNEMYRGGSSTPMLLDEARVSEIVKHRLEQFTMQRKPTIQAVEELAIADPSLKKEVISFVTHRKISPSQIKKAWATGLKMRPHLKVIADADRVSEKELKGAINGYIDTIPMLGDAEREDDISIESIKARSFLMMLAQGDERHGMTQELHRQITEAGPFRSYRRATNYYRHSFCNADAYLENEDFYSSSMQRTREFATWTEGLGLVLAEELDTPGGEQQILNLREYLDSSSEIDEQTLTLMRNTGIKIPTPDRFNQEGSGRFCDAAMSFMEERLTSGDVDVVKDDICQQFLMDMKRATAYFNGEKVTADNIVDTLKAFCTDDSGKLDRNMLFAVSQMHQGIFAPAIRTCVEEQLGPIYGIPVSGFKENSRNSRLIYRFDKNDDGSVSVRAVSSKYNLPIFSSMRAIPVHKNEVPLDGTKSEFEVSLNLRLNPATFSTDRENFVPPEVIDANYKYSLYIRE